MKNNLTVVMYHYVRDLSKSKYPKIKGLDNKLFNKQIKYFKKNYNFVTINDIIDVYDHNASLPNNPIILTFDDGYKDHYTNVYPVLLKNNITGCFYPPATTVLEKKVLDVNKIHFILASNSNENILIKEIFNQLDKFRMKYDLESNEYYFNKYAHRNRFDNKKTIFIKRILQTGLNEKLRFIITKHLFEKYVTYDEADFSEQLYMNTNEIIEMVRDDMHFGSHGHKHYWLSSLSKKIQENEINNSIKFLRKIESFNKNWSMCYPYGDYNKDTLDILSKHKCKIAFTTKVKIANLNLDNRLEIPRMDTNDYL